MATEIQNRTQVIWKKGMKLLLFFTASLAFIAAGRAFIQSRKPALEVIGQPDKVDTPVRQNGAPVKLVAETNIDPAIA